MKDIWNQRFAESTYAYGEEGNVFMTEQLQKLHPGLALFPAEGEGRNAVYAAKRGWSCIAYDSSAEGRKKALQLCAKNGVHIDYRLEGHLDFAIEAESVDLLILIFAHVPEAMRSALHEKLWQAVKPGGHLILEGFSKDQLGLSSGGPKELSMLFDKETIAADFSNTEWLIAKQGLTYLEEGVYHQGKAQTLRLFGRKKSLGRKEA